MSFRKHQRIHSKSLGKAIAKIPYGWYMVVAIYPILGIMALTSEIDGQDYWVTL